MATEIPAFPVEDLQVVVSVNDQALHLYKNQHAVATWPISTSKFGIGSEKNSQKTPLGRHRVATKIGAGAPLGTWFVGRQNTGKIAPIITEARAADGDYVTSRILWLEGLEEGGNRGGNVDSYRRYIYIHGTAEEGFIGRPASHGCIRMKNADVIDFFDRVPVGTIVDIRYD